MSVCVLTGSVVAGDRARSSWNQYGATTTATAAVATAAATCSAAAAVAAATTDRGRHWNLDVDRVAGSEKRSLSITYKT